MSDEAQQEEQILREIERDAGGMNFTEFVAYAKRRLLQEGYTEAEASYIAHAIRESVRRVR